MDMQTASGLAHSVPPFQTAATTCSRCGKDFHIFRPKKNCYNCGSMVCESCSTFKTKLPQFGYNHCGNINFNSEVRCCEYCAHFLQVSKMDFAALSKLNIKTLRGYLHSYNIPIQGLLEKQDLIRTIQSYKPIPEASEVYFREHLPNLPERSSTLFEEMFGLSKSDSSSRSSRGSSSSSSSGSGDGWWDIDKFFSKLFGDDRQPTQPRQSRSQSQTQPQAQRPPHQPQSQPQPQAARPANTGTANPTGASYQYPGSSSRPPPSSSTQSRPTATNSYTSPPRSQPQAAPTNSAGSSSRTSTLTLEGLMSSGTDLSTLSIKSIKTILDHHCVTYVGVVEKQDLVERLQKLIDNTKAEQEMLKGQEAGTSKATSSSNSSSAGGGGSGGAGEDDNLCKICCDAALNCVMLNCNHMATCMDCGKQIMEGSRMCPICRQYVVRLLHIFRA